VPGSRSIKGACQTLEKQGADKQKRWHPHWVVTLQKKIYSFCDGQMFFIDRGLLMGAKITTLLLLWIAFVYHSIFSKSKSFGI
jgi:hypothetical protein